MNAVRLFCGTCLDEHFWQLVHLEEWLEHRVSQPLHGRKVLRQKLQGMQYPFT